ncbi:SRPBCC domain-containing protein [Paraflavitalea speifideaquila]|uniref:SRPBCC family protein n=1 Tax=Paraflavitalea speifideaquila TaxID=3076558 RepID=UPI0028F0D56F|nr:SRPBCC domain-containing protein [Paraflavitalea speifideiaquila]
MSDQFNKTVHINAQPAAIWMALTDPEQMKQWMGEPEMDLEVETSWQVGSPFLISGFHHVRFINKGTLLQYDLHKTLQYTHLSSISRLSDKPEHYTWFKFELAPVETGTALTLTIDNFPTAVIYQHLNFYWRTTLEKIRLFVEAQAGAPVSPTQPGIGQLAQGS